MSTMIANSAPCVGLLDLGESWALEPVDDAAVQAAEDESFRAWIDEQLRPLTADEHVLADAAGMSGERTFAHFKAHLRIMAESLAQRAPSRSARRCAPKAWCPGCGKQRALDRKGRLRQHLNGRTPGGSTFRCSGSGQEPKAP